MRKFGTWHYYHAFHDNMLGTISCAPSSEAFQALSRKSRISLSLGSSGGQLDAAAADSGSESALTSVHVGGVRVIVSFLVCSFV